MYYSLILAGGKGTRLYPLSRDENPKQFLKIINGKSFLQNTVDRISPIVEKNNIYVITSKDLENKMQEELPEIDRHNIIVEPCNKETATCISLAAVKLLKKDKDALMVVLPSDHHIEGDKEFQDTIEQAMEIADRKRGIITIGVNPNRPETGYGYIEMGDRIFGEIPTFKVERFLEKPNVEVAKDLLSKGTYLWNSGIFVFRADVYLRELEKYLPKMYKSIAAIYDCLGSNNEDKIIKEKYDDIDGISVDFGIMQKTRKAYVIKCEFQWDDIGTFAALSRFLKDFQGNNITGNTLLEDSENCSVFAGEKLIIGFGVKNLIVVDSDDVILIMDKNKDQEMKHLVNKLKEQGYV